MARPCGESKNKSVHNNVGFPFSFAHPGNEKFRSNGRAPYAQKNLRVKKKQKPVGQSSQKTAHPSREQMYTFGNCGRKLQNFYIRDPVRFFPPCINRQKTSAREATTKQPAQQASCKSGEKKKKKRCKEWSLLFGCGCSVAFITSKSRRRRNADRHPEDRLPEKSARHWKSRRDKPITLDGSGGNTRQLFKKKRDRSFLVFIRSTRLPVV